jgi:membrane associated rhomboid family serine protease
MVTIGIIIVTVLTSLAAFARPEVFEKLCFNPYLMHRNRNEWFRFISVGFVHADLMHLAFNMLTLYFFGSVLEGNIFSEAQYLIFYLSALVLSGANDYAKRKDMSNYTACGASGAVSAIMFSLVLFNPWGVVYLKFIIPIYFILFAVGYVAYSWYMEKRGGDNIGHGTHLWGALYGIAYTLILKPEALGIFLNQLRYPPFMY